MERSKNFMKKKITLIGALFFLVFLVLMGRLVYLMVFQSQYYSQKAEDIEERERDIKAARGRLIDANGKILATNETVLYGFGHTQSDYRRGRGHGYAGQRAGADGGGGQKAGGKGQFHRAGQNQCAQGDRRPPSAPTIWMASRWMRTIGAIIPTMSWHPRFWGFTGGDNQGIVGLESRYESYLKGTNGKIPDADGFPGCGAEGCGGEPSGADQRQRSLSDAGLQYPVLRPAAG